MKGDIVNLENKASKNRDVEKLVMNPDGTYDRCVRQGDDLCIVSEELKERNMYFKQLSITRAEYGMFTKFLYEPGVPLDMGLSGGAMTRIFYLSTFIGYDGMLTKLTAPDSPRLVKEDCRKLIGMDYDAFSLFWKEAIAADMLSVRDNAIWLNSKYFMRGKTPKRQVFMRIGHEGMRSLFESCDNARQHKLISYILKLIPMISVKHGVICKNPLEINKSLVCPLRQGDVADAIGYDRTHITRIIKDMLAIRINFRSQKDVPVFMEVPNGIYGRGKAYIINPRVCCAASAHSLLEKEIRSYGEEDVAVSC